MRLTKALCFLGGGGIQSISLCNKNAFNCLARLAPGQTGIQLLKQRWSGLRARANHLRVPRRYQFPRHPPPAPRSKRGGNGEEYVGGQTDVPRWEATEASYVTQEEQLLGTSKERTAMLERCQQEEQGCKFIASSLISSPLLWVRSNSAPPRRLQLFSLLKKKRREEIWYHFIVLVPYVLTVSQKALRYSLAIPYEVDTEL